jgi:ribulose-phosphate 3-epimerase
MNQIIPAILPKNQSELSNKAKRVAGLVSHVQVDVCDGVFVPSKTSFSNLPMLEEIEYELDLMIDKPEASIEKWIDMQPARVVMHVESVEDPQKLFLALELARGIIEIGLSISNDTSNDVLEKYIDDCDFIQLMGISKIGAQGELFDERVLEKISYFHAKYPDKVISIDGSVNENTIKKLADAGATRFVCGSAVFEERDVAGNIEKLAALVE